ILVVASGKNPLVAYWSLVSGALGSWDRVAVGLNKATPYLLAGVGVALCFRARIINIGGEGQIAVGGLAATWMALSVPNLSRFALCPCWSALPQEQRRRPWQPSFACGVACTRCSRRSC